VESYRILPPRVESRFAFYLDELRFTRLALRSNRARLQRRRAADYGLTTPDHSAQSLEGRGSGSARPLELALADWPEELAVFGTARNLRDQELAYQLSLIIENLYLVNGSLRRNS
jgi:hypothetical protein